MDARAKTVREILYAGNQYLIPFFQREYSWKQRHWKRLRDDLWALLEDGGSSQHFLGPLVCTPMSGNVPAEVPAFQLIDGQQRLTTLTLILAALRDVASEHGMDDLAAKIQEDYLLHKREKGLQRYKVVPRLSDRDALIAIVEGHSATDFKRFNVYRAWMFFRKTIGEWTGDDPAEKLELLFKAIVGRLSLVMITIDGENPYEIFESLNSTGLPLEESDLIRNYLFMQVPTESQPDFNTAHWEPFEEEFDEVDTYPAVSSTPFYRNYLMREGVYSKARTTFVGFKEQSRRRNLPPDAQVAELKRFGRYELMLRRPPTCSNDRLRSAFREIATLEITTAHPLVMNLMDRFESAQINEDTLLTCLHDMSSFVLRRSICGESTRSYGRWFCEAIAAIKDDPREDLSNYWLRRGWPDDASFLTRLVAFPIYRREAKKCRLILEQLEQSYGHKEKVVTSTLTIEHVMPQTIDRGKSAKAWKEMLGENWKDVHQQWLHTLGNLTLSGYNPDLGNKPYVEKKGQLIKSNLVLNSYFASHETWGQPAISERGEQLAKEVAAIWPRPAGKEYIPPGDDVSQKVSQAERRQQCLDYWADFLTMAEDRDGLPMLPNASRRPRLGCAVGRSGFRLIGLINFSKRKIGVALACRGPNGPEHFSLLQNERQEIEAELGEPLLWQELASPSTSYISLWLANANPANVTDWSCQHEWLAIWLERFYGLFSERCRSLGLGEAETEGRGERRQRFWNSLLERAASRTSLHAGVSAGRLGWIATGAGLSGLSLTYVIAKHDARVELYLDRGKGRKSENKQIFDGFHDKRSEVENVFGDSLSWERLDSRRACRIAYPITEGGYRDDEQVWPSVQDAMIDAMIRLEMALAPRITDLKTDS